MKRRPRPDSGDAQAQAAIAPEAHWWAERSQLDVPLDPRELARFTALLDQDLDRDATVAAVLAASVAPPRVAAGLVARSRGDTPPLSAV